MAVHSENALFALCRVSQVTAPLEQSDGKEAAPTKVKLLSSACVTVSVKSLKIIGTTNTKPAVILEKVNVKLD